MKKGIIICLIVLACVMVGTAVQFFTYDGDRTGIAALFAFEVIVCLLLIFGDNWLGDKTGRNGDRKR